MSSTGSAEEQAAAQLQRAIALLDMGRHQDAIPLIADSLRLNPDPVETYCYLAMALRMGRQFDQALKVIEDAIRKDPNHEWPHRQRSLTYHDLGKLPQALASAREAHRLNPDAWQTKHTLSDALLNNQQLHEARQVAEDLKVMAPDNVSTFNQLGRIAMAQDQLLEAEMYFREALRIDPMCAIVHDNLGRTLFHQGRVKESVQFFDSAVTVNPTARDMQSNLYASARALRGQTLLAGSESLLARISPKVYQYFLHREEGSFRVLFCVFLVKFFLPLSTLIALLAWGVRWQTGGVNIGTWVLVDLALGTLTLWLARRGPWRSYFEASPRQVQIITTLAPLLLSPVTLVVVGVIGLKLHEELWGLYLLMVIVGTVFLTKLMVRKGKGHSYKLAARVYPAVRRQRARLSQFLTSTAGGRRFARAWKVVTHPMLYVVIGFVGMGASNDSVSGAWWLLLLIVGATLGIFKIRSGRAP